MVDLRARRDPRRNRPRFGSPGLGLARRLGPAGEAPDDGRAAAMAEPLGEFGFQAGQLQDRGAREFFLEANGAGEEIEVG